MAEIGTHNPVLYTIRSLSFRDSVVLFCLLVMNTVIGGLHEHGFSREMTAENSANESFQLVLIGLALPMFLHAGRMPAAAYAISARALAAVCAIAFYREIEIANPPFMLVLTRAPVRDIAVSLFVILLLAYLYRHRIHLPAWWDMLWKKHSWPLIGAGLLLLAALLTDIGAFPDGIRHPLMEELMESNGYFLLLVAAFRHNALTCAHANASHDK